MTRRGRRLALIALSLAVVGAAAGLSLYALSDSIVFFYSPSEVVQKAVAPGARLRIGGMVNRLATRLASNGGGVDEWSRLIRAYAVLHEADKAKAALADARRALAPDPNAVASLDALAHDLGLGDAN